MYPGRGKQLKSLCLPDERLLRLERMPRELTERNLGMHLEDPTIRASRPISFQDPVAHSVTLTAGSWPSALVADQTGLVVIGCLDNQAWRRWEHATTARL